MALFGFELEEIARLVALVEAQGLEEFIYEEEGRFLRIRGARARKAARQAAPPSETSAAAPASPSPPKRRALPPGALPETVPDANQIILESPMVGVFYRAEKPGAPPLVNVGDRVSVGQTVGVLEAMKVFSEFKAEQGGVIVSIPVKDGQLVQAKTPLLLLRRE